MPPPRLMENSAAVTATQPVADKVALPQDKPELEAIRDDHELMFDYAEESVTVLIDLLQNGSAEDQDRIEEFVKLSRRLLPKYDDKEALSKLAGKKQADFYPLIEYLEGRGLSVNMEDPDQLFLMMEIAQAVYSSYVLLDSRDPKYRVELAKGFKEDADLDYLRMATQANHDGLDLFLSVQQRFNLEPEELIALFERVFRHTELSSMFRHNGLANFERGVRAGVDAYIFLHKYANYGGLPGRLRVSSVDQDMLEGIDMVYEASNGDEKQFFDIKGINRAKSSFTGIFIVDMQNKAAVDGYIISLQKMDLSPRNINKRRKGILEFQRTMNEKRKADPEITGWAIVVPL